MARTNQRGFPGGISHLLLKKQNPRPDLVLCVVCLIAGAVMTFIGGMTVKEKIQITLQMDPNSRVLSHALPCFQGVVEMIVGFTGIVLVMAVKKYPLVRTFHCSLLLGNQMLLYIAFWVICNDLNERLSQNETCRALERCATSLQNPWEEDVYIFVPCRSKKPLPVFCDGSEMKRIVCDVILVLVYIINIYTVSIGTLGNPFRVFLDAAEQRFPGNKLIRRTREKFAIRESGTSVSNANGYKSEQLLYKTIQTDDIGVQETTIQPRNSYRTSQM